MSTETRQKAARPYKLPDIVFAFGAIAIVLLAWRPVVFGGRTFDGSSLIQGINGAAPPTGVQREPVPDHSRVDLGASAWQTVPWAEVTNRELKQGIVPLWNPYQAAGSPLAANMQSAVFDPMQLAVNLHPTPLTWDFTTLFCFALGSLAMYVYSRNRNLGNVAALTGAVAFSLCGYFVINNNNTFVRTYTYIPILMLAVDKVAQSAKPRWAALLGGVIAASLLSGMPEASFFSLILAGIYALYRIALARPGSRIALLLWFAGSGLLGLALAAPLLTLFVQFVTLSSSANLPGSGLGVVSRTTLLNWFAPLVNGYQNDQYAGQMASRSWSGTAAFVLALVAVCGVSRERRRDAWMFLLAAVVVLLKMHGFPGVQWLGQLPAADRAIWPAFAPPVANFCLAAAAAIGVDGISRGEVLRFRLLWIAGVVAVLLGVLFLIDRPNLHPAAAAHAVRNSIVVAALAGGIVGIFALLAVSSRRVRRIAATVAAVTVLIELQFFIPVDGFPKRVEPFQPPPWLDLMSDRMPADRVFGFDSVLYPNTAGVLKLQDIRTLDALYVGRYSDYVQHFVSPSFDDRFTGEGTSPSEISANRMFDLLGVRYVLAADTSPSLLPDSANQFELLGVREGISVYRNNAVIPRAFVAGDVHAVGSMHEAISYLQSKGHRLKNGSTRIESFDPRTQAVVETKDLSIPDVASSGAQTNAPRTAEIVTFAPDRVEIQVPPGPPGLLVLTDTFYPGWVASVNGKNAAILPTDVAFRGVVLGSDASSVIFRYAPKTASFGLAIAAAGILVFLAVVLIRRLFSRFSHNVQTCGKGRGGFQP